jgi:hypothetical protein
MSVYAVGSATVTAGSATVTLIGADLTQISVGQLFRRLASRVFYEIASIDYENNQINLSDIYVDTDYYTYMTGEVLGTGTGIVKNFTGTLGNVPIIVGTVSVTDGVEVFTDNGDETLTGDDGGTGVIDYSTGVYYIAFKVNVGNGVDVTCDYRYGLSMGASSYQVVTDYTPNYGWPEVNAGDSKTEEIISEALEQIDEDLFSAENLNVVTTAINYTVPVTVDVVLVSGAITITLGLASLRTKPLWIFKTDSGTSTTIRCQGANTIEFNYEYVLSFNFNMMKLVSDQSNMYFINAHRTSSWSSSSSSYSSSSHSFSSSSSCSSSSISSSNSSTSA